MSPYHEWERMMDASDLGAFGEVWESMSRGERVSLYGMVHSLMAGLTADHRPPGDAEERRHQESLEATVWAFSHEPGQHSGREAVAAYREWRVLDAAEREVGQ